MKYIILENIRSAHNVGAIFRTADGAGVSKVFLVGYTPTPIDRFGRQQAEIKKTSLGASVELPWEHVGHTTDLLPHLRTLGCTLVAVEQCARAVSLKDFAVPANVAYIVGNEVTGVEADTLDQCDAVVDVPMLGAKESLNVATTAGIVLYHGLLH